MVQKNTEAPWAKSFTQTTPRDLVRRESVGNDASSHAWKVLEYAWKVCGEDCALFPPECMVDCGNI